MSPALGARRKPPPGELVKSAEQPAPTGGMNTVDPGRKLPATDCIYAYNLIPGALGLVSRTGWAEWATGLLGSSDNTVRTIIPFHASSPGSDKLFATTSLGIADVTNSGAASGLALAFATASGNAGWGIAQAVVTAGGHFLLYADEVNGLHYYSETTGAWAAYTTGSGTGQISGLDPANVVSVTVWKNRVWLTERGSARSWYLDAGAVFGTATAFNFGGRFAHGGYLVGLFNGSADGGSGLDTFLVAIGSGGDVVIYAGTDPASASTFGLRGVRFVGGVPAGRRIATDLGDDLLIISAIGLVPLSQLLIGNPVVDRTQFATKKIGNLFGKLVAGASTLLGWSLHIHPTDNALLVLVPTGTATNTNQLAMSTASRGWTRYRDLPMFSAAVWEGVLYFGTADGRVCRNTGDVDNVLLSDAGESAQPIQYSLLVPYRGDARNKQVQMVRPIILAQETSPLVSATVLYDWSQEEPAEPTGDSGGGDGSWDYGLVEGAVTADQQDAEVSLQAVKTSDNDFPADNGTIFVDESGPDEEVIAYLSWDGSEFLFEDPTTQNHLTGETVRLISAPDDPTGTWDTALWGGADTPAVGLTGASGMGKDFAIAIRGAARSQTTIIGMDILYTVGGFL